MKKTEDMSLEELEEQAERLKALPRTATIGTPGNTVTRDELLRLNSFARALIEATGMPSMAIATESVRQLAGQSSAMFMCRSPQPAPQPTVAEARERHGLLRHSPTAQRPAPTWKLPPSRATLRRRSAAQPQPTTWKLP